MTPWAHEISTPSPVHFCRTIHGGGDNPFKVLHFHFSRILVLRSSLICRELLCSKSITFRKLRVKMTIFYFTTWDQVYKGKLGQKAKIM
jgi:hypothetical protein